MNDAVSRKVRIALGVVLTGVMAYIAAMLIPPYFQNSQFQRYLDTVVERQAPAEVIRAEIVNKAAQMGLPLHASDIRLTPRPNDGLKVEIIYVNRVDMKFYTVDLHFRPSAER